MPQPTKSKVATSKKAGPKTKLSKLRIESLSTKSGLAVSTIRYYQREKILAPPKKDGRMAWYEAAHLNQLQEIRRLLNEGFSIRQIAKLHNLQTSSNGSAALNTTDPVLNVLNSALQNTTPVTRKTLIEKSGLSGDMVDMAILSGLVHPMPNVSNRYHRDFAEMLGVARRLLEGGVDAEALLTLAKNHNDNIEVTATSAIGLFASSINKSKAAKLSRSQLSKEIQALIPQIVELVAWHFRLTLATKAAEHLKKSKGATKNRAKQKAKQSSLNGKSPKRTQSSKTVKSPSTSRPSKAASKKKRSLAKSTSSKNAK